MTKTVGTLTLVLLSLLLSVPASAQSAGADPALCLPAVAALARQYPTDWEEHLDPTVRPMVIWQRVVGTHAEIIGWSDEQPNPTYTHPRVVVDVSNWDHSDLFALGLPRTYDNKPVVIHETVVPQASLPGQTPAPIATPVPGCAGGAQPAGEPPKQLPATGAHSAPRNWVVGSAVAGIVVLGVGILAFRRRPSREVSATRRS